MSEQPSDKEGKNALYHRALNLQLERLFNLLPDASTFRLEPGEFSDFQQPVKGVVTEDASIPMRSRRKTAELGRILPGQLAEILTHAQITTSFREFIITTFNADLEWGISKDPASGKCSTLSQYTSLFQWDKPGSGGIFDPEEAKTIEHTAYRRQTRYLLIPVASGEIQEGQKGQKLIQRWREEFIEKYADEP